MPDGLIPWNFMHLLISRDLFPCLFWVKLPTSFSRSAKTYVIVQMRFTAKNEM